MRDFSGNEIQVGDTVAYCIPSYSQISVGRVINVTPTGATVEDRDNKKKISRHKCQIQKIICT